MENKITQRDYFNAAIANLGGEVDGEIKAISTEDMIEFFRGRIAQLNKKSNGSKDNEKNMVTEALKDRILEVLSDGERKTVTQIIAEAPDMNEIVGGVITGQKVSAVLKKMVDVDKTVNKDKDKKTTVFFVV